MAKIIALLLVCFATFGQTLSVINTGTTSNDGTGDSLRTAFTKANTNFYQLWSEVFTNIPVDITNSVAVKLDATNGTAVNLTGSLTNVSVFGNLVIDSGDELQDTVDYSLALTPNGNTPTENDASPRPRSVATIASLVADVDPLLVPDYARISVLGYYAAGDGGGGDVRRVLASSGTTNRGTFFISTANPTYAWSRIWDGTTLEAEWFGATTGDDISDSAAIQDAVDLLESIGRGVVRFGGGVYDLDTPILLKYRVSLIGAEGFKFGEGFSFTTTNALYLTGGITQFKVMDGANCDALWMYATNGYVRQPSETIEDGGVYDSRFQDSMVRNIVFNGNSLNNSSENLSAIRARNKWTINIENCGFISWRGNFIDLWDVNASRISDIWAKGNGTTRGSRGLYVYSSADNIFSGLYLGGFQGPAITMSGESTFKNLISDVISYNDFATNTVFDASSVDASGVWTFASAVPLASGQPIELRTTGTLPSPFTDTQLYWSVKLTDTTFGIHTNYALATNGTYLACSGGSGTHSITIGPATGLYLTYNSKYNTVVNYRSDQMSGPGIVLRSTRGNVITALEVSENTGIANGETITEPTGVKLEKDADDNQIAGTSSAQTYGAWVADDAARNQLLLVTNNVTVGFTNAGSGFNYTPALLRLNSHLGDITTAGFGTSANGATLTLTGGAGGVGVLKLLRPSSGTNSIGVSGGTITFKEDTQNRNIAAVITDGSTVNALRLGATSGQAAPRQGQVVAEDASGTDVAGANLTVRSGLGTGNASGSQIQFFTPTAGASGSSAQSYTLRASINSSGLNVDSGTLSTAGAIELGHASDTTLARSAAGVVTIEGSTIITSTTIRSGTGTPEGAVTAPVGTLFLRTDGGAGTTLYVKESGAGNTGWVAK